MNYFETKIVEISQIPLKNNSSKKTIQILCFRYCIQKTSFSCINSISKIIRR
jgi:hypothetical protein